MSIIDRLTELASGGIGKTVTAVLDRVTIDPLKKRQLEMELLQVTQKHEMDLILAATEAELALTVAAGGLRRLGRVARSLQAERGRPGPVGNMMVPTAARRDASKLSDSQVNMDLAVSATHAITTPASQQSGHFNSSISPGFQVLSNHGWRGP